ncbi:hypothetical protein P879_07721, partial [Paragonimus westermani]
MQAPLVAVTDVADDRFDAVVFVNDNTTELGSNYAPIEEALTAYTKVFSSGLRLPGNISVKLVRCRPPFDPGVLHRAPLRFSNHLHLQIFCPTGALNTDTADIRNVYDTTFEGFKRVVSMGFKSPMLCVGPLRSASHGFHWMQPRTLLLNALLGAYHACYTPLEVREMLPEKYPKVTQIGVMGADELLLKIASAIEEGRWIARDVGGS